MADGIVIVALVLVAAGWLVFMLWASREIIKTAKETADLQVKTAETWGRICVMLAGRKSKE